MRLFLEDCSLPPTKFAHVCLPIYAAFDMMAYLICKCLIITTFYSARHSSELTTFFMLSSLPSRDLMNFASVVNISASFFLESTLFQMLFFISSWICRCAVLAVLCFIKTWQVLLIFELFHVNSRAEFTCFVLIFTAHLVWL